MRTRLRSRNRRLSCYQAVCVMVVNDLKLRLSSADEEAL